MSAKPLAIVSLFAFASFVWCVGAPAQDRTTKPARQVKVMAQLPGVIDFIGISAKSLAVGDRVARGQVLVQLDDRQAERLHPENVKAAQLLAAQWEKRMTIALQLCIAREEKDAVILTYHKYRHEAAALREALDLAQACPKEGPTPLERAELAVGMHCVRSPFNGIVRAIYKTRGEGVKSFEAILLIEEVRE
jgi:multidrug resistance efflux pump